MALIIIILILLNALILKCVLIQSEIDAANQKKKKE